MLILYAYFYITRVTRNNYRAKIVIRKKSWSSTLDAQKYFSKASIEE